MPSRLGSPNRDKVALRDMAARHGVDVVEMQVMMIRDLKKTYDNEVSKPRSRRSRQFLEAEDKLMKLTAELTPYFQGKLSNVTVTDESPRPMVIRAPDTISDTSTWLEMYRPKSPAPSVLPIVPKRSLDIADGVGTDDPKEIVAVAEKLD
jgi:hypothetical protein